MSATQEHTRRPVHAGCQMKHDQHTPSEREAHAEVQQGRGDRSTPEAPMEGGGKPVHAGGPTSTIR